MTYDVATFNIIVPSNLPYQINQTQATSININDYFIFINDDRSFQSFIIDDNSDPSFRFTGVNSIVKTDRLATFSGFVSGYSGFIQSGVEDGSYNFLYKENLLPYVNIIYEIKHFINPLMTNVNEIDQFFTYITDGTVIPFVEKIDKTLWHHDLEDTNVGLVHYVKKNTYFEIDVPTIVNDIRLPSNIVLENNKLKGVITKQTPIYFGTGYFNLIPYVGDTYLNE